MKPTTSQALNRINFRFYTSDTASNFSNSRQQPWSGWKRVLDNLPDNPQGYAVLDVGCGNGRFAAYLSEHLKRPFTYLGIDNSQALLNIAQAKQAAPGQIHYKKVDIIQADPNDYLEDKRYSLIAVFGLLHHIPGFENRCKLLQALLAQLHIHGIMAITFWRFAMFARFQRKMLPWQQYNASSEEIIEIDDLEEGDHLLKWGEDPTAIRYCHFADNEEIERLLSVFNVECIERYHSDGQNGQLNEYIVLKRSKQI